MINMFLLELYTNKSFHEHFERLFVIVHYLDSNLNLVILVTMGFL